MFLLPLASLAWLVGFALFGPAPSFAVCCEVFEMGLATSSSSHSFSTFITPAAIWCAGVSDAIIPEVLVPRIGAIGV